MTKTFPPIPNELKSAFAAYLCELEETLKILSQKNSTKTFSFSEIERIEFQQRFHRLKGSSGFFQFKELIELAHQGEVLFEKLPSAEDFSDYQAIFLSINNHLESLKTMS